MSITDQESNSRLSLLVKGLGTMAVDLDLLKGAIDEVDARLEANSMRLQESWSDLVNVCNSSVAPIKSDITPSLTTKEAIDLLNGNTVQSLACPSEPMVLNCFLNNVVQAIERNPGLEQAILQDLISFCTQQGIMLPYSLPFTKPDPSKPGQSIATPEKLNSTSQLWDSIRSKLITGLWKAFNEPRLLSNNQPSKESHLHRLELLQSLAFLYPVDSVWDDYMHYRWDLVEKYASNPELLTEMDISIVAQYKDAPVNAIALAKFGRTLEIMIFEDMKVLEVMFLEKVLEFKWIFEVYLERFTFELRSVLQAYREEKRTIAERHGSSCSTSSMSIHGEDLLVYKVCFLVSLSLEMTVSKMLDYHETTRKSAKPQIAFKNTPSGKHQLPKLSHKPAKAPLQGWADMPPQFGAGMADLPPSLLTPLTQSPWAWREEFKHVISRISTAVSEYINVGCNLSLDEQARIYNSTKRVELTRLRDELVGGLKDYPKCIAKSCSVLMTRGDEVLPLASSTGGRLFQVVRSSFVDTFDSCLKTFFSHIMKIVNDFPKSCGIEVLYTMLSSSIFVKNHLAHYEEIIGTEPRRPFAVLHRQYSELVDTLTNQITNYHNHIITMVILQDPESHNWSDQKPFFESLSSLALRYSHVIPSSSRTKQMRCDVTALLLSCLSFMWSCCPSVAALLDKQYSEKPIPDIHNLCHCLLASMAIVTCPLDILCKYVTGKRKKRDLSSHGHNAWAAWIYPEVLRSHEGSHEGRLRLDLPEVLSTYSTYDESLGALPDRQALYVLFKIMINQPSPNWPLIVQALVFRNARLPVTIVKYGGITTVGLPNTQAPLKQALQAMDWYGLYITCYSNPRTRPPHSLRSSWLSSLGAAIHLVLDFFPGKTEIIFSALRDLIVSLTDSLNTIPAVVFQFFYKLQDSLDSKSMDSGKKSAGIKVFSALIYRWLLDADIVGSYCELQSTPSALSTVETFAELTWFVLTNQMNSAETVSHAICQVIFEKVSHAIAVTWYSSKEFEDFPTESIHEEITNLHFRNTASGLLQSSKGEAALAHIYRFLVENKNWLMNLVIVPGHILPPEPTRTQTTAQDRDSFNPLKRHALIGEWAFDQEKIASFPIDWGTLLSSLSLPSNSVRTLVFNRSEMHEESKYLDEDQKDLVHKLKSFYGVAEPAEAATEGTIDTEDTRGDEEVTS
ncbi:predicted protein [Nematostella vectensis]|uniref:Uncharacterized protein n=1 Tax=Nematostella vectensis TaxID=45351 RepID=A7SGA9_NEMVE|nr:predicted protein [Nematostella vectensis]|eukprot:XP_001629277.1 predicted protein [Nematostella vectensis]